MEKNDDNQELSHQERRDVQNKLSASERDNDASYRSTEAELPSSLDQCCESEKQNYNNCITTIVSSGVVPEPSEVLQSQSSKFKSGEHSEIAQAKDLSDEDSERAQTASNILHEMSLVQDHSSDYEGKINVEMNARLSVENNKNIDMSPAMAWDKTANSEEAPFAAAVSCASTSYSFRHDNQIVDISSVSDPETSALSIVNESSQELIGRPTHCQSANLSPVEAVAMVDEQHSTCALSETEAATATKSEISEENREMNHLHSSGSALESGVLETHITTRSSDEMFQPIIIDVRGGLIDFEASGNKNNNDIAESNAEAEKDEMNIQEGQGTGDVAETMQAIPKSALELLKGMLNNAQNGEMSATAAASTIVPTSTSRKTANVPSTQSHNMMESSISSRKSKSVQQSNKKVTKATPMKVPSNISSKYTTSAITASSLSDIPVTASASMISLLPASICKSTGQGNNSMQTSSTLKLPLPLVTSVLPNMQVSTTSLPSSQMANYSCVIMQDSSSSAQNKVALLIPGGSSLSNLTLQTPPSSSDGSPGSLTFTGSGLQNIHNNSASRQSPLTTSSILDKSKSVDERIADLVTRIVNEFHLQGSDLAKHCDILGTNFHGGEESSSEYFICPACGENFHYNQGLKFHLERHIFNLKYDCVHCKEIKVFNNKCALWKHLKDESDHSNINYDAIKSFEPYNFGKLKIHRDMNDALPPSQNVFSDEASAVELGHTRDISVTQPQIQPSLLSSTISPNSSDSQLVTVLSKSMNQTTNCVICKQSFLDIVSHLGNGSLEKYLCPICHMILPTCCALQAHYQIHVRPINSQQISCPECGECNFQSSDGTEALRALFDHLDSCQHFNRTALVTCDCGQKFLSFQELAKHFTTFHMKSLFSCPLCVLAFTKHEHFVGHYQKVHKLVPASVQSTVLCAMCHQILKCAKEAKDHVVSHFKRFKTNPLFHWKCFICRETFSEKPALQHHAEEDHPHKSKRCTICFRLFSTRKNLVDHIVLKRCVRTLPLHFNFCFDLQPGQEGSSSSDIQDLFNKLFTTACHTPVISAGTVELPLPVTPTSTPQSRPLQLLQRITANKGNVQSQPQDQVMRKSLVTLLPNLQGQNQTISDRFRLFQCHPCRIVISGKNNYHQHLKEHTKKGRAINEDVTRCVVCKKHVKNDALISHLKIHQSQGIIICSRCQRRDFKTARDALNHSLAFCEYRFVRGPGSVADTETSAMIDLEQESQQSASENSTEHTGRDVNVAEVARQKDSGHTTPNVFPCLFCGLAFQCLQARDEHVSRQHGGTRIVYHCLVCQKRNKSRTFTSQKLAVRHICKKHRIVNTVDAEKFVKTEEQNISSGKKLAPSREEPVVAEGATPPKRLRIAAAGDFMCGKCGFSCSGSGDFSKHISSHSTSNEPQCPECGLCFTVLPALKKHLFAVHKIKAVEDYLKEKNISEPEMVEDEIDLIPEIHPLLETPLISQNSQNKPSSVSKKPVISANECTVCYKVFDSEASLKTHMRNHGMAFIRSKRHKN